MAETALEGLDPKVLPHSGWFGRQACLGGEPDGDSLIDTRIRRDKLAAPTDYRSVSAKLRRPALKKEKMLSGGKIGVTVGESS